MDSDGVLQFARETRSATLETWALSRTAAGKIEAAIRDRKEPVAVSLLKTDKPRISMLIIEKAITADMNEFVAEAFRLQLVDKPVVTPKPQTMVNQQVGPISVSAQCQPSNMVIPEPPKAAESPQMDDPLVQMLTRMLIQTTVNKFLPSTMGNDALVNTIMGVVNGKKTESTDILANLSERNELPTVEPEKAEVFKPTPRLEFALKHHTITTIQQVLSTSELEHLIVTDQALANTYLIWLFRNGCGLLDHLVSGYLKVLEAHQFRVLEFLDWQEDNPKLITFYAKPENFIWLRRMVSVNNADIDLTRLEDKSLPGETRFYLEVLRKKDIRQALDNGWFELVPENLRKKSEFLPGITNHSAREWRKLLPE